MDEKAISHSFYVIRKAHLTRNDQRHLTLRYCKQEFLASITFLSSSFVIVSLVIFSVLLFEISDNRLPLKFYIVFLPFEGLSLNWLINYVYQVLIGFITAPILFTFFTLTWIIMNHCCWGLDEIILEVEAVMDQSEITRIVEKSIRVLNFQEKVQKLLQFNFFVEFSVLSFIFCLTLYSIALDPFGSVLVYAIMQLTLTQLFISCWMGNRVNQRLEHLTAAVYDIDWVPMNNDSRKGVLMILMWSQKLNGFNGIFNQVNMQTLQRVEYKSFHPISDLLKISLNRYCS